MVLIGSCSNGLISFQRVSFLFPAALSGPSRGSWSTGLEPRASLPLPSFSGRQLFRSLPSFSRVKRFRVCCLVAFQFVPEVPNLRFFSRALLSAEPVSTACFFLFEGFFIYFSPLCCRGLADGTHAVETVSACFSVYALRVRPFLSLLKRLLNSQLFFS